jgi:hypothetical protein
LDPAVSRELETQLASVYSQASKFTGDRKSLVAAAGEAAKISSRLAVNLNNMTFDRTRTSRLLRAICADADHISAQGPRSAEQATMALDSAFIAYAKDAGQQPDVRSAINALFTQLENPSAYSAPRFATAMKRVGAALK